MRTPARLAIVLILLLNIARAGADPSRVWRFAPGSYWGFRSTPLVMGDRIYTGSLDKNLYCIDSGTGTVVWASVVGGRVTWSSPASARGVVAVGCEDGLVYGFALDTGAPAWTCNMGGRIDGSVSTDGERFFVGSTNGKLCAISASDGKLLWTFTAEDEVFGKPLAADGRVYFGAAGLKGKTLYCVNAATGEKVFAYDAGATIYSSPMIVGDSVVFGTQSGRVIALDKASGAPKWSMEAGGAVFGSPVLVGNTIVFGSQDSKMRGVDAASGRVLWEFSTTFDEHMNCPKDANQPLFTDNHLGYVPGEVKRYYPGLCSPVAEGGDAVFPIAYGVFRLDPATGRLISRVLLSNPIDAPGVAVVGDSIYLTTRCSVEKWSVR